MTDITQATVTEGRLVTLTRRDVRVVLEHIGEGFGGDYDPVDRHDAPLVRFTVQRPRGEDWEDVECGSYCTHLAATDSPGLLARAAAEIADAVEAPVRTGESIKARCEALSWLCADDGELHVPAVEL